jgi:hypothetical protein
MSMDLSEAWGGPVVLARLASGGRVTTPPAKAGGFLALMREPDPMNSGLSKLRTVENPIASGLPHSERITS